MNDGFDGFDGFDIERELFFAMEEETNELGTPELDMDRMRRSGRRRTAVLAGGAAAVVAVGVGTVFALGSGGGKGTGTVVADHSAAVVSTAGAPTTAATDAQPPAAGGTTPSTGATLWPKGALPSGCTPATPGPGGQWATQLSSSPGTVLRLYDPSSRPLAGFGVATPLDPNATVPSRDEAKAPTVIVGTSPQGAAQSGVVVLTCANGSIAEIIVPEPSNVKPVDVPLPSSTR